MHSTLQRYITKNRYNTRLLPTEAQHKLALAEYELKTTLQKRWEDLHDTGVSSFNEFACTHDKEANTITFYAEHKAGIVLVVDLNTNTEIVTILRTIEEAEEQIKEEAPW